VGFGCFLKLRHTTGLESAGEKQLSLTVPELVEKLHNFSDQVIGMGLSDQNRKNLSGYPFPFVDQNL